MIDKLQEDRCNTIVDMQCIILISCADILELFLIHFHTKNYGAHVFN